MFYTWLLSDLEAEERKQFCRTLDKLYRKHNADTRPFYRQMRSLSESDVIVVKRGGERKAYYVDAVGFQEVPSFLKGLQKLKERGEAR